MISDRMDINQVLSQMRDVKAQMQNTSLQALDKPDSAIQKPGAIQEPEKAEFGQLFDRAVNSVNELQSTSKQMAIAYEQGQPGTNITDVMIASQKASVSFQAMVQVRNKLVEAYRDVMNMPV